MGTSISYEILEITERSPKTRSFLFDFKARVAPGQFMMTWVPGREEIPISVSHSSGDRLEITVYEVGDTTKAMNSLKIGDYAGLRGPYGKGFELKGGNVAVVSGGCGAAPIGFLAEELKNKGADVTAIVGARDKENLIFLEKFKMCGEVLVATDDGSEGHKGFVTEVLEEKIKEFNYVYTCGPEIMMKRVLDICVKNKVGMQASLERYMKCGIGICGSCLIKGLRVCKEGPVFDDS
ncbi:MAG: dihydroorotate dehydrogenase electron transfer subunit, partial [archaeon]